MRQFSVGILLLLIFSFGKYSFPENDLSPKETLGKVLFFDKNLSASGKMSCATCHDPTRAFQSGRELTLADGTKQAFTGAREIPSLSYAAYSFSPRREIVDDEFFEDEIVQQGGFFADGRANSLGEQILGPLFSPIEMGNKSAAQILEKIKKASYLPVFEQIYGKKCLENADSVLFAMGDALAAFEKSKFVNPFSSKFDDWQAGRADLTEQELIGLELFTKRGKCKNCHVTRWHAADEPVVLFTKYIFENIGTPAVPNYVYFSEKMLNPLGEKWLDEGLFLTTKDSLDRGKFKVPTLRNVAVTAPYMHNGSLKTLEEVVHFYNKPDLFPPAEVPENVNKIEIGNLNLLPEEEVAIVAFLKTLTDK
jgi:cytochrome c peroxidase